MTCRSVEPATALAVIRESLVLSFEYRSSSGTFTLICEYREKAEGSSRAVVMLRFDGVRIFRREAGRHERWAGATERYSLGPGEPPVVLQAINFSKDGEVWAVELWFGHDLGGALLQAEKASALVRDLLAQQADDSFLYYDFATGDPVSFYAPFEPAEGGYVP